MLIDWFTVSAQALNFLILVWLLKRFLYKPILNAIDVREKNISKELADADVKKAEAQKEHEEFQHKNEEFDQQRAALFSKATDEAKAERQHLFNEARVAADALTAKRTESLRNNEFNLSQAIRGRTQQEVFAIARKVLIDLASTSLEERMIQVFTRRLRTMESQAKADLSEAVKTAFEPALVRSAFDLPEEQRAAIKNALNETFSAEIRVNFETAPDLVSGIQLTVNGHKLAWSIADYLSSLQKSVEELLKQQGKPEPKNQPRIEAKEGFKSTLEVQAEPKTEAQAKANPAPKIEPNHQIYDKDAVETRVKPKPEAAPKTEVELVAKLEPQAENQEQVPTA